MKKLTALLLVFVLCLGLTACGATEDEKALEAANALMEAGDWEAALSAYSQIPMYQEISKKMDEANTHIVASKVGPYVGTWKDLNSDTVMTVRADGTMQITEMSGESFEAMVWYDGEDVFLYSDVKLTVIDGVTHLKGAYNDFVSAEDYESLSAKLVEITMENWETYFELREAKAVFRNGFGEVEHVSLGYGIFLRDEYAEKLKDEWDSVHVTFRLQYEEAHYHIEGDYPNGEWYLGEQFVDPYYDYAVKEEVGEVYLSYFDESVESDFIDRYAASFTLGYIINWDNMTQTERYNACVPINPVVMEVSGTLNLFS